MTHYVNFAFLKATNELIYVLLKYAAQNNFLKVFDNFSVLLKLAITISKLFSIFEPERTYPHYSSFIPVVCTFFTKMFYYQYTSFFLYQHVCQTLFWSFRDVNFLEFEVNNLKKETVQKIKLLFQSFWFGFITIIWAHVHINTCIIKIIH